MFNCVKLGVMREREPCVRFPFLLKAVKWNALLRVL